MEAAGSCEMLVHSIWQKTAVFNAFNVRTWNMLFGCSCVQESILLSLPELYCGHRKMCHGWWRWQRLKLPTFCLLLHSLPTQLSVATEGDDVVIITHIHVKRSTRLRENMQYRFNTWDFFLWPQYRFINMFSMKHNVFWLRFTSVCG